MRHDTPDATSLRRHYRRLLAGHRPAAAFDSLESMNPEPYDTDVEDGYEPPPIDLSDAAIRDRIETTRVTLLDVVDRHLGGGEDLRRIVYQLLDEERCVRALGALRDDDEGQLEWDADEGEQLEAIVQVDGSRPSFMVRHGEIDRTTSPMGSWERDLDESGVQLTTALSCVGRIDDPAQMEGFAGTGFLVQENLIVTNRHVLQLIAAEHGDGSWTLKPGLRIDFGHEYNAQASVRPRLLDRVVFAPPRRILPPLDHTTLDLALIALVPADKANRPPTVLSIDTSPDWTKDVVYVVGYPARPVYPYQQTLLQQLFQRTYGHKRVAPGRIMPASPAAPAWQLAYDATTLGGSSGSAVLLAGGEDLSVAVHYAGQAQSPGVNWAQKLGLALDETDGIKGGAMTLREHLYKCHVTLTGHLA